MFFEDDTVAGGPELLSCGCKLHLHKIFPKMRVLVQQSLGFHESFYIPRSHNDLLGNPRDFGGNGQLV